MKMWDACDMDLSACKQVTQSQEDLVNKQVELMGEQAKRIAELEASDNSLWKSPVLWFVVGSTVGVVTGVLIKR
jgi:hypothetical protein